MDKKLFILVLLALVVIGFYGWYRSTQTRTNSDTSTASSTASVEYTNSEYGFGISLPQDWSGYSIIAQTWTGDATGPNGNMPIAHGPLILIRNPKWTQGTPYQDIPIMVFTISQWNEMQADKFHIGAAPINPSELGRNARYVFALPARYNYAFPAGYEEVDAIIQSHPLRAF